MHSDPAAETLHHSGRYHSHNIGERAAVCIAKHCRLSSRVECGFYGFRGVVGVFGIAVEEMLRVKNDLLAGAFEEGYAVAYHAQVFFPRDTEDFGDVYG